MSTFKLEWPCLYHPQVLPSLCFTACCLDAASMLPMWVRENGQKGNCGSEMCSAAFVGKERAWEMFRRMKMLFELLFLSPLSVVAGGCSGI